MNAKWIRSLFIIVISIPLVSCGLIKKTPHMAEPPFRPQAIEADQYAQKVDTFMVLLDASFSMAETYTGTPKLNIAKEVVNRMNQTIPDLKLTGAMRTFGRKEGKSTTLIYGPTGYSKQGLAGSLATVKQAIGGTPLALAMNAANQDLATTKGNIALIIVSDGLETQPDAVIAAKNMKSKFGDKLCIYTVLVGDDPAGKKLLESVAKAGQCGFSVSAQGIYSSKDMADFVRKVFLALAKPMVLDSDGDGVPDNLDKCPGTPQGVKVDSKGCPLDSDGDGVPDYLDKCPDTPKGASVNKWGCWIIKGVLFDTAKWEIKPQAYPMLIQVVDILKKNPQLKLEIQGHTDNVGSTKYNQGLSEKRAKAVKEYLIKKGIMRNRLTAKGYGESKPAAVNATPQGRAQNRRVELKPIR